jgi:hypothetical protein
MGREKAIQATRAQMNTKTLSLKSLSGWVDFGTWRGFDPLECVLEWMLLLLYWMRTSENLDANEWGDWGGGIYSLQPLPRRWLSLLVMGTPDSPVARQTCTVHWSVRATTARPLGFGANWPLEPLSCSCTGQSGATPDMSGDLWLRCSESAAHYSCYCLLLQTTIAPLHQLLVAALAHRTCPMHTG